MIITTLIITAAALYLITRNTPVLTVHKPTELDRLLAVDDEDWYGYSLDDQA
jgi:hypothetical protein